MGVQELNELVSTERKMDGMMCGVTLRDRINSTQIVERVGVGSIEEWLRRGEDTEVGRVWTMEKAGVRGRGRPARR